MKERQKDKNSDKSKRATPAKKRKIRPPQRHEIQKFIDETQLRITKQFKQFMGLPLYGWEPEYSGPLTPGQQLYIYQEIDENICLQPLPLRSLTEDDSFFLGQNAMSCE